MEKNDFAAIWLAETGNPAIEELAQLNLDVAEKAKKAITDENLSVTELSVSLDINPDEINRWLNGRHNFSVKIINEILDIMASSLTTL